MRAYQRTLPLTAAELRIMPEMGRLASCYPMFWLKSRYLRRDEHARRLMSARLEDWSWWELNRRRVKEFFLAL